MMKTAGIARYQGLSAVLIMTALSRRDHFEEAYASGGADRARR